VQGYSNLHKVVSGASLNGFKLAAHYTSFHIDLMFSMIVGFQNSGEELGGMGERTQGTH
jgi:hypothetical protein